MKFLLLFIVFTGLVSCSHTEDIIIPASSLDEFNTGCEVKLLGQGHEALLHRIKLIRSAKSSIELQTFIWTDDECGRILLNEFCQAARRGVKVRLLCDHLFSNQDAAALSAVSNTPNLEVKVYNPAGDSLKPEALKLMLYSASNFQKVNQRMHNKLLLIDHKDAVCGGRNIEDTYYDNSTGLNFKDLDIAVRGPVCGSMKTSFEHFWRSPLSVPAKYLKDVAVKRQENLSLKLELDKNELYQEIHQTVDQFKWRQGYMKVEKMAFFSDLPGKNETAGYSGSGHLNNFIVSTLAKAKQRIWIQSPYLVFSNKAQKLFAQWRRANEDLDIKISTNSLAATDSWPTYAFLYKQKKMFIEDLGIEIYEFNPLPGDLLTYVPRYSHLLQQHNGLRSLTEEQRKNGDVAHFPRLCLHAKCMLIDDDLSFIGSYNLDPRSANLNTELSVVIMDKAFNKVLADHIAQDCAARNSWVVAKRKTIKGLQQISDLLSEINHLGIKISGIDLWPRRYTSCFALREGAEEVSCDHKDFYKNYHAVGNFPRVGRFSEKEVLTRFFKAFAKVFKPIL